MRGVALGLFALIMTTGLFVPQVEAKDKDKHEYKHEYKNKDSYGSKGSVPIPGTLLLFGGGFVGLMVRRTKDPRP